MIKMRGESLPLYVFESVGVFPVPCCSFSSASFESIKAKQENVRKK